MREHGTKTTPVFLPAVGEASWSLLPSLVSLLSDGTVQLENTYSCILKVTGQVWESQKRMSITLITATNNVHLPKPVSTDLTIKPDSVLTNPIEKDVEKGCEAGRSKTSTLKDIFIMTPSLEGWPTKAKEAPSPHEVRLTLLDINPVF